ncbi:MAG: Uma2 family endonuclease [Hyphomicrobiaceae bacterium]
MQQETRRRSPNDLALGAPTDPEAFAAWVANGNPRQRDGLKFELSCGRITVMQAGVSRWHNRVCLNIVRELVRQLDADRFDLHSGEFAVKTDAGIRYPDIMVERIPSGSALPNDYAATQAIFLTEVLSPSSVGRDFTEKLVEYTSIEHLRMYLICSQEEPRGWVWEKKDGSWPPLPLEIDDRSAKIPIAELGIELDMAAIYRGIPDPPSHP